MTLIYFGQNLIDSFCLYKILGLDLRLTQEISMMDLTDFILDKIDIVRSCFNKVLGPDQFWFSSFKYSSVGILFFGPQCFVILTT